MMSEMTSCVLLILIILLIFARMGSLSYCRILKSALLVKVLISMNKIALEQSYDLLFSVKIDYSI